MPALQVSTVQATPSLGQSVASQQVPHLAVVPSGLGQQSVPPAQSEVDVHCRSLPHVLGLHGSSCGHCESLQQEPQPWPGQHVPPSGHDACVQRWFTQLSVVQGSVSAQSASTEHCSRGTQPVAEQ